MTELVGARAIAQALSRLAGIAVSEKQVYRLAEQQRGPIRSDRERWTISADGDALEAWWANGHFPRTFGKRLRSMALGRQGARVAKRKQQAAVIYARSSVGGELRIVGDIGGEGLDTRSVLDALKALGEVDTIHVVMNSGGGIVNDGLAIYHALRSNKARIEVEILGVAASMASAVAMAGDKVSMAEDGLFMLHDPWAASAGNADDLRAAADTLEKYGETMAGIYARRTKFTEAQILELMGKNGGDGTWLNAEEAKKLGFIDEILVPAQARLPVVPAAALAKRITRRGVHEVKKFYAKLTALIAALAVGETSKEDVIDKLAVEAEMTAEDVGKIVDGKSMPTLPELRAFADVLGCSSKDLRELAEGDGHKFDKPAKKQTQARQDPPAPQAQASTADVQGAVQAALAAERQRQQTLLVEARNAGIPIDAAQTIVNEAADLPAGRQRIIAWLGDPKNRARVNGISGSVIAGDDDRDKWLSGMEQWLLIKAGQRGLVEAHTKKVTGQLQRLDPGQFRGLRLIDIARESLERDGVSVRGMAPLDIAQRALAVRADSSGLGTTSDFPVLLENVLHKMLLAAYETAPDQWRMVAAVGSVQDFRAHPRLRLGSLSKLDSLLETGEFKQKHFPDAEKETIQAATKGNIIGLTRQSIVNDDIDGFSRMTVMLGRASALTIEIDLFALFALNSGLGPTMQDGSTLFHANHSNIDGTAGAPNSSTLEAGRVLMAQQKDPEGNDFLNLRPDVWVGPIGKGADVRTAIQSQYHVDTDGTAQFGRANIVRDLVRTIVDTPRLTGTRWYLLADPAIAPVFEVVFLQGEEAPVIESIQGFDFDGVKWRVRHDFGVGATDTRGATTNAGG